MKDDIAHRSRLVGDVWPGVEEVKGVDHIGVVEKRSFIKLPNLQGDKTIKESPTIEQLCTDKLSRAFVQTREHLKVEVMLAKTTD